LAIRDFFIIFVENLGIMKNFFLILAVLLIGLFSCKKNELEDFNQTTIDTTNQNPLLIYGRWKLIDGRMYFRNLDLAVWYSCAHFGPNRTTSCLRYSGFIYEIELIKKDTTVWEFKPPQSTPYYGKFILNYDYQHPYMFYVYHKNWSIIQIGGSSRPIKVYKVSNNQIMIQIEQVYESIRGYNYTYFSELLFEKI